MSHIQSALLAGRLLTGLILLLLAGAVYADQPCVADVRFLIPAGPGGGLDSTARVVGDVMVREALTGRVAFENMAGGGGARAMSYLIENAAQNRETLLVNSTPLLIRHLQGVLSHNYTELVPVAGVIGDPGVFAVSAGSDIRDIADLLDRWRKGAPLRAGGGSVRGSLDHVVLGRLLDAADLSPRAVGYLPYDGGGKALLALLGGEIHALSSGLGETLGAHLDGRVRILAVTSPARIPALPDVPTLTELKLGAPFANWRGFFAPPGTSAEAADRLAACIQAATQSAHWQAALDQYGWQPRYLGPADFSAALATDEAHLRESLTALGFLR